MLKEIVDSMPMAGVILDRKGAIEHCNDSLLEMTGWRGEEVTGSCWFETFVPKEGRVERKNKYREAMISGAPIRRYQSKILTKNGNEICILWNGVFFRDEQGNASGLTMFGLGLEDIPIPGNDEQSLRKYDRIGRAAAGLAHDLNNLLFPVINYSRMILDQTRQGSELHDYAGHIFLAGKRGKLLARQMLSAIRGMDEPVKLEELDIAEVVVEFSELIRSMLGNNVSLKTDASSCVTV